MKYQEWVEEPGETFWMTVDWNGCGMGRESNTNTILPDMRSVFVLMSLKYETTCPLSYHNTVT